MESIQSALQYLQQVPLWGWAAAVPAALLLGWLSGRRGRPRPAPGNRRAEYESGALRELQKTNARLEAENAALSNFFLLLPDFTKEINSRIERRAVWPLLMRFIERLFAPTQALLFHFDDRVNKLVLVQQRGLADDVKVGFQLSPNEGRIGWVVEHKVAMDVNDFVREIKQTGISLEAPSHFRFQVELCAPMLHEGKVYGVVSVGGVTRHYKYEKTMLKLIADLGCVALHNNALFLQVQEMANQDGLTRLCNKRFFLQRLSDEILKAEKAHYPVSLFIFDLDNFKHYNDTQGHQAGDEVLRITGQILREMVRPDDIAARYGGEEFVVVLPHTPKDGAMIAAERIRARVAEHPYPSRESQPLGCVSLSGGVATFPDDGRTGADLIKAADAALYESKHGGRNQVRRSEPQYFSDGSEETYYKTQGG